VCAPSRAAFFTGRNSGHFGATLQPHKNWTLIPDVLKASGYKTAVIGKSAPLNLPTTHSFDYFWGQHNQVACHNMYPIQVETANQPGVTKNTVVDLPLNNKDKNRELCMANPEKYNYTTDAFHAQALSWLDAQKGSQSPFFLYMAYTVPHAGGWNDSGQEQGNPVPTDFHYAGKDWPDVEKDHAGSVTYMDKLIGELLQKLKDIGVDDNTVVFFASDNGAHNEGGHSHLFFNSTGGLRGFKRSFYEGGIRSPSIVRWPGVVRPNTVSNVQWAFWDVLPTFCDIVGAPVPASAVDGRSFLPTLHGHPQPQPEYLYWTWTGNKVADAETPGYSVRAGHWKGVVHSCADAQKLKPSMADDMELYNLNTDPFETNNIASERKSVVEDLKKMLVTKDLTCRCYQC